MIGFPGIGIEFQRNPVIFRLGEMFALTWYGLIIATGFLLAVLFCLRQTKHFGLKQDELIDMLFFAVPAGIIGSRIFYVAFRWDEFSDDLISIVVPGWAGLSIHGAVIGATAAALLFCWVRHINFGAMADVGAMGLLIAQAIGRWGNFVNGEVYGTATDLPWRMRVHGREVHPLFLYECLWNLLGLALLRLFVMKRRKYNGMMFTIYIAWYGLGRGLLEGMRASEFNLMAGDVMISQIIAVVSCVAALALLFFMTMFKKHPPLLEWTAERDEYETYRKTKRRSAGANENTEEMPDEGGADNGDTDGREDAGEDDQVGGEGASG
jgi:phosphatidylglycerol:prolipoprotein diacylglycerol transferase